MIERGIRQVDLLARASLVVALLLLSGCSLFTRRTVRYIEYPVRSGDTLSGIGGRFGVSHERLADINGIDDPRELQVGQIIKVPYNGSATPRRSPNTYASAQPKIGVEQIKGFRPFEGKTRRLSISPARDFVGRLAWPVGGGRLSSTFGYRWLSFHEGIDIAAPIGTAVYAAHDGQVVYSGDGISGYGNLVVVRAPGLVTVYAHNDSNEVSAGEYVRKGDKIGEVGQTGHATGPHLHFETRIRDGNGKNVAVDPVVFFRSR